MPPATNGLGPASEITARRRAVALAGHHGDSAAAREALGDAAPGVRATALGALARTGRLTAGDLAESIGDPAPEVRARAAELAAAVGPDAADVARAALSDGDARVVEAGCFALGELGPGARGEVLAELSGLVREHPDPVCREAAVAALGAIGAEAGLPAILHATTDKPAVRRRAVLALAPFDGPQVDAALARARTDRDWQVRQAAEDLGERRPPT
jgi:HEAT repeat protein